MTGVDVIVQCEDGTTATVSLVYWRRSWWPADAFRQQEDLDRDDPH